MSSETGSVEKGWPCARTPQVHGPCTHSLSLAPPASGQQGSQLATTSGLSKEQRTDGLKLPCG
eukprot:6200300-Pyramimonas_sp.AAC.1